MNILKPLTAAALAAALSACAGTTPEVVRPAPPAPDAADSLPQLHNLIVFFNEAKDRAPLLAAARAYGAEVLYNYQNLNAVALKIPPHKAWTKPSAISPRCPAYWPPIATKATALHPVLPMKR